MSFFERTRRSFRSRRGEVGVQIRLEFVEQDCHFGIVEFSERCDLDVDEHGACVAHGVERRIENGSDGVAEVELLAQDSDARAMQALRIEEASVVRGAFPSRGEGGGIGGISACERAEKNRRVGDAARHRAGGVLAVRDRDDAGPAHQSDGGLDADDAVGRGRTDDRAVGLSADSYRAEIRGDRRRRSRNSIRRDCGRARRDSASGRRGRSSRSWNASSGSWPTR